ncbi:lysoplasmalogenase [Daejeonella sp.]|uniref:lysoplasmalogenase n=1 Tax=Daejeonella sp. TaxID=2805397 RepID=UPI0039836551
MLKRHALFTVLFLFISGANIFVELDAATGLNLFVKPLICISLAIYLLNMANLASGFNRFILAAIILSLFGDFFLLFAADNSSFFMFGLIAFLIAHVLYSMAFFRDFKNDPQASKFFGHLMLFFMGVFSLSFYTWIRDYLDDLRIPVMAYMFVISIMVILAGYRYHRVNLLSFRLIYFGAIFFVISDSSLAYNKFVEPFPYSGVLIMGTYMLAQYLIVIGAVERVVVVPATGDR